MRATSAKIRRNVAKVKRPRATDAPDDLPFGHLKRCLLKLSPTYRTLMEGFRVADAVDEVVNVLDAVRAHRAYSLVRAHVADLAI